ncbi:hypothetical protein EMPG_17248 [Blastomyces silverae]|uniref:Uncharacterized protein n=1 Tax=Blastomyces silverae TaxID=2060906 RepID=A0A0H1B8D0_9EURO|nr:hypothetical protein EMPG_17248 [Blastomyces silverae]
MATLAMAILATRRFGSVSWSLVPHKHTAKIPENSSAGGGEINILLLSPGLGALARLQARSREKNHSEEGQVLVPSNSSPLVIPPIMIPGSLTKCEVGMSADWMRLSEIAVLLLQPRKSRHYVKLSHNFFKLRNLIRFGPSPNLVHPHGISSRAGSPIRGAPPLYLHAPPDPQRSAGMS